MTNYERQKNETIEEMAERNVYHEIFENYDVEYQVWITSDGTSCMSKEDAIKYEIDWLNQEAEDE